MPALEAPSLFELDEPNPTNLFFALEPPSAVAAEIGTVAQRIGDRESLKTRPINVLHMTVGWFGPYQDLGRAIDTARQAGDAVKVARFDVELTRMMHFGGGAIVLAPSETPLPLADLWRQLAAGLKRPGFKPSAGFSPHVTIAYAHRHVISETPLERPIRWAVNAFAPVSSRSGASEHERRAIWTLD